MPPRDGLYFLLTLPSVYRLFRTIVRGDGCRVYISEYVQPRKILRQRQSPDL